MGRAINVKTIGRQLLELADAIEVAGVTPEVRRFIDRTLLHDANGDAGELARAFTEAIRAGRPSHYLRSALTLLGDIMLHPRRGTLRQVAGDLRLIAGKLGAPPDQLVWSNLVTYRQLRTLLNICHKTLKGRLVEGELAKPGKFRYKRATPTARCVQVVLADLPAHLQNHPDLCAAQKDAR